ncbi:S41 family peptidase [Candidatus Saccharibacteria bacterium]|nr:S41 family peptidase [Candidatus Saccharibacteria bacterium]
MREGSERSKLLFGALIIATISFVAGTRIDSIYSSVAPLFGVRVSTSSLDLQTTQEVYRKLKAEFDGEINDQQLIYGASRGLVQATGDPYTVFMDPDEVKEFEMSMNGDIGGGIGAEIGLRDNKLTIIRPLKGSPAEQSGLLPGDIITKVNDKSASGWTVDQVVSKIRGDVDSKVNITVIRDGESKDFSITRQKIVAPTVESEIKDGVGILTVHRFNDETGKLSRTAAEEFVRQGVNRVVLDLRGNPGGTVSSAKLLAGLWLDNQVIMTERRGEEIIDTVKSIGQPILGDTKTVVLINGGSASASEIIAGALKDHGKATLVGEKSFGKGSVQALVSLSGGAQMRITQSRWFTPNGKNIDHQGIEPDKQVELTAGDVNKGVDPQLNEAMKL